MVHGIAVVLCRSMASRRNSCSTLLLGNHGNQEDITSSDIGHLKHYTVSYDRRLLYVLTCIHVLTINKHDPNVYGWYYINFVVVKVVLFRFDWTTDCLIRVIYQHWRSGQL